MLIYERNGEETKVNVIPCEILLSKDLRGRNLKIFADNAIADNGEPLIYSKYVFDGSDRVVHEEQYRYSDSIGRGNLSELYKTDYSYDDNGRQTATTDLEVYAMDGSGKVTSKLTYTNIYDANDNKEHNEFLASTGEKLYVEARELDNKYDDKGNLISVDTYVVKSDGSRGEKAATDIMEYDGSGNLIHEVFTSLSKGKAVEIHEITFEYDNNGLMTHKHIDIKLPDYTSFDSSEDYVYEYDEEGNVTKEECRKEDPWAGKTAQTTEYFYEYNR